MNNLYEKLNCKECKREIIRMEEFEGGLCVDCFDRATQGKQLNVDFTKTINKRG